MGYLNGETEPPQWDGLSERRNQTLLDMVRSMMSQVDLPLSFWGYALETVALTLSRVPTKSVEKTPHGMWIGKHPRLSFLKVWGCEAQTFDVRQTHSKIRQMLFSEVSKGNQRILFFTIKTRAKCLLLAMVSS
jgi:hypothetical protein